MHGRKRGEYLTSVFHDSHLQCLQFGVRWSILIFPQLLSLLHSGVQICLFPVFWSGIICVETRETGEESSGASRIGHSCLGGCFHGWLGYFVVLIQAIEVSCLENFWQGVSFQIKLE